MKTLLTLVTALILSCAFAFAQQPAPAIPEELKPAFAILKATYPKIDAQKFPKAPADSVWLFRSAAGGAGTVEVGFQGSDVVYMVFRRSAGGKGWTADEVTGIHRLYSKELLKENFLGQQYKRFPMVDANSHDLNRLRYGDGRIGNKAGASSPINAAFIARKDFDISALMSGL